MKDRTEAAREDLRQLVRRLRTTLDVISLDIERWRGPGVDAIQALSADAGRLAHVAGGLAGLAAAADDSRAHADHQALLASREPRRG